MPESPFPPEVPQPGDLLRISPIPVDNPKKNYKFFCEEAFVTSRFYAEDYADRKIIEVFLGGTMIRMIRLNLVTQNWHTDFDGLSYQVEVEKISY